MSSFRNPIHCLIPPHVFDHMAQSKDPKTRRLAVDALTAGAEVRTMRSMLGVMPVMSAIPSPAGKKHRLVYDMQGKRYPLPGKLVRSEGSRASKNPAVNEAYNGSGTTYDFYLKVLGRNSLDDRGMALISSVHFQRNYNNAFWNGEQMAYGDGDGQIFRRFTGSVEVIGHELTHGVVTHTCNLEYENQPGALNEHFADVFGCLVEQWKNDQTAKEAGWLIGNEIMGPAVSAKSLRTMKAEKAYENDPILGTDPQPKHMTDFYKGSEDYGGVHINSGIPNHAFYLVATALGGRAWEKAGLIWYDTMLKLQRLSQFQEAAETTVQVAGTRYGNASLEQKAVRQAWKDVGIKV